MNEGNELLRLEGFVSTLLEKFNKLQVDKHTLEERLQQRERTIAELQENLNFMKSERGEISDRVSSLIGRIEDWEAETTDLNDSKPGDYDAKEEQDNGQPDDFEGDESSKQGNLFSAE